MSQSVLVVAAHPDDEVLGCGGAMFRHTQAGDRVKVIFVADGESARSSDVSNEKRKSNARKACEILGVEDLVFLDLPDNRLDGLTMIDIVQKIEKEAISFGPDVIYTHHVGDLNVDHQLTFKAVMTAFRPQPGRPNPSIYSFEVLSSTGWSGEETGAFVPNYFVDIEQGFKKKIEALKFYDDEMRDYPHARSYRAVEALAEFRGAMVGLSMAEGFVVVRQVKVRSL